MDREELAADPSIRQDLLHTAQTSEHSSSPDQTSGPSDYSALPEHTPPVPATPESRALSESGERIKELLVAYQVTLEVAKDLPAVVWVRWGDKGISRFLKVPYLRWYLWYFLTHHVNERLNALNQRLHAIAALANDPDINKADRESVKLYLQSVPPPPYKTLAFTVVIAAVLVTLPLQNFGNVLDVLPLIGAILRLDITYLAKAFQGSELGDAVRATIVLALGFSVVAAALTSPFVLKRRLFNLYPLTKERIAGTTAREQALSVDGLYILEEQVFREVGLERPKEGRWDLLFQTFVLVLLLLLSLCLGFLALAVAMSWDITLKVDTGAPANVQMYRPEVHWIFYALPALIFLMGFVALLKRLIRAWRGRKRPASA